MTAPPPGPHEPQDPHEPRHAHTPHSLREFAHEVRDSFDVPPGAHEPLADLAKSAGARLHDASRARRRWAAWVMLLIAICAGATGTTALSATAGFTAPGPTAVMVVCYLVCFVALTRALRVIPMSIAYAIWSGIGIALVTLIGWRLFEQRLNAGELTGIALIVIGAVVIQFFSRTTTDAPRSPS